MLYKNLNLRTSTILDLDNSPEIKKEFGINKTQKDYNNSVTIEMRIKDFLDYAEMKKLKDLEDAVHSTFKKELEVFSFE